MPFAKLVLRNSLIFQYRDQHTIHGLGEDKCDLLANLVSLLLVSPHVFLQTCFLVTTVRAHLACKWLLSWVDDHVFFQVFFGSRSVEAQPTGKRLLSSMSSNMINQICWCGSYVGAEGALMCLLSDSQGSFSPTCVSSNTLAHLQKNPLLLLITLGTK